MSLINRTVVIAGASGKLGSYLAGKFANHGTRLALLGNNPENLHTIARSLALPNSHIFTQGVDLLDAEATKTSSQAIIDKFGRIDIFLHLVGGWTGGKSLVDADASDLAFMLNRHVWTSFNVIQAFVPSMIKNGWGRIIMITSPFASRPMAKGGPYSAGKAGQEALMLTLSKELKGTGVTANLLQAKTIDTNLEKVSAPTVDNATWTTLDELNSAILYLVSDEAGVVNGAKVPLFGAYNLIFWIPGFHSCEFLFFLHAIHQG